MNEAWFHISLEQVLYIPLSVLCIYLVLICLVRLNGLRSFSKMSSFDFAITVAIGSVIAATIVSKEPTVLAGALAVASLLGIQRITARLRYFSENMEDAVDNCPLLLMEGPEILWDNLKSSRVTLQDLQAKLREANCLNYEQVRAVVLEATGDISVLHSTDPEERLEPELLEGIRR